MVSSVNANKNLNPLIIDYGTGGNSPLEFKIVQLKQKLLIEQNKAQRLARQNENLRRTNANLYAENGNLLPKVEEYEDAITSLRREVRALKLKKSDLEFENVQLKMKCRSMQRELSELTDDEARGYEDALSQINRLFS